MFVYVLETGVLCWIVERERVSVCVYCEWDVVAFAWFGAKHTVHSSTVIFLSCKVLVLTSLIKIVGVKIILITWVRTE